MLSSTFPLDSFIREQTSTGRPKLVYRYVLETYNNVLDEPRDGKFVLIMPTQNEMPFQYLRRVLRTCQCKDDIKLLWPNIGQNTGFSTRYVRFSSLWMER